jgi:flagellar hook-basal body complex protein FliE
MADIADIRRLDVLFPKSEPKSGQAEVEIEGQSFSDILKNALNSVNDAQVEANEVVQQVLSGQTDNIHETMIALQKADTSLKLMLEVRNKLLEAYQEVMRTQM